MGERVSSLKNIILYSFIYLIIATGLTQHVFADEKIPAYELLYDEHEPGTDTYIVRFTVTDRYIRIDDLNDDSGFILYDDVKKTVYSVSHFDKSILVIPAFKYEKPELKNKIEEAYEAFVDAPQVSGKTVYNYRVSSITDSSGVCIDIQLVPGLLPDVTKILNSYRKIVVGQQAKTLTNTPEEYQTTCFLYDQIFNDGKYYEKGLPIQERYSNGKTRILTSYKQVEVNLKMFETVEGYREYSLE